MESVTRYSVLIVLMISILVGVITDLAMQGTGQFNPPTSTTTSGVQSMTPTTTTSGVPTVTPTTTTSAPV